MATEENNFNTPDDWAEASRKLRESELAPQVANSLHNAATVNPVSAAQTNVNARFLGIPPESAAAYPDDVTRQVKVQKLNPQNIVEKSPVLAKFLTVQSTANAVHDDVPNAQSIEQITKTPPAAAPVAKAAKQDGNFLTNAADALGNWYGKTGTTIKKAVTEGLHTTAAGLELSIGGLPVIADKVTNWVENTPNGDTPLSDWWFKNTVEPHLATAAANAQDPNATLDQKLIGSITKLGGMLAEIGLTGPVGVEQKIATELPTAARIFGDATTHMIKSMWMPGTVEAIGTGHKVYEATGDGLAAFKAAFTQYGYTNIGGLIPLSAPGGLLVRAATGFASGATVGEATRQGMNKVMPEDMQTPFSWEDAFLSAVTGSLLGAVMGPRASTPMGAKIAEHAKAMAADADHAQISALGDAAAQSTWRANDDAGFHEFVSEAGKDGHLKDLYVPAETFAQILDKAGVTPEDLKAKMPRVAEQMNEALSTKGDVQIPVADYATYVAGGKLDAELRQHLKADPEGMSKFQADEFRKGEAAAMVDEAAKYASAAESTDQVRESQRVVQETIQKQLDAVGRFPSDVNKQNATIQSAILTRIAKDQGILPEEALAKYGSQVTGELPTARGLDQQAIDEATGLPLNPDGTVTLYHHTSADKAEQIAKSGALKADAEPDVYLTTHRETDTGYGDTAVAVRVDPAKISLDDEFPNGRQDYRLSVGKPGGSVRVKVGEHPEALEQSTPDFLADANNLLADFDEAPTIDVSAPKMSEKEIHDAEQLYLSHFPANTTTYRRSGGLLKRIRAASEVARHDIRDDPAKQREVNTPLGPFSGYRVEGVALEPDSFNPNGKLEVHVYGKEQIEAGLIEEPALTFEISPEGEITVNGPSPSGATYAEFSKRGWADLATDAKGEAQAGWTKLKTENGNLPISQVVPLIADVHARTRAWRMEDYVGMNWSRATGALGGLPGMNDKTAVFFQGKEGALKEGQTHVEVDGVQRHALNSNGKPIARTEEGVRNFWRWFGDSKVVDSEGRPLVVYHGRSGDFDTFNTAGGKGKTSETGAFFTLSPEVAATYTGGVANAANIVPVYLHLAKPLEVGAQGRNWNALGKKTKLDIPARERADADEVTLATLGGREPDPSALVKEKASKTTLGKLFPREFVYSDGFSTDDLARWARDQGLDGAVFDSVKDRGPTGQFHTEEAAKPSSLYVAFKPEQIKSATGNSGEFDPTNPSILKQKARGTYNPMDRTISLLKDANLSTYLHETGHWILDIYSKIALEENAPPRIKEDMDALLKWFGVESLEKWHDMTLDEQRDHHEQLARGFEAYLMEGKAPSQELVPVFQRIRAWMLDIYKSIRNLNVDLTPEVRGVFDRMLASDETIKQAQDARVFEPVLAEKPADMSDKAWADYQALGQAATNEAIDNMQGPSIRVMKWLSGARSKALKDLQRQAKEARAETRLDAAKQVMVEPIYQAWQFLTLKGNEHTKALPDAEYKSDPNVVDPAHDDLFTAIAKLGGLNRDEVKSEWGAEPADMPKDTVFGKPVVRKTGGHTLDDMAAKLVEHNYLDARDLREFEDKFMNQRDGEPQYSWQKEYEANDPNRVIDTESTYHGKLQLADVESMFGKDSPEYAAVKARRMTSASEGLPVDIVATTFGFDDPREFVRQLAHAETPHQAIEAATDVMMMQRHGELATPEAREEAANDAVHNEGRARFMAAGLKILAKSPVSERVLLNGAREAAQKAIAAKKVGELNPRQYLAAETRANKEAIKLAPKDPAGAVSAQRAALLNNQLVRAAYDAQDLVRKALAYAKSFDKTSKRLKISPEERDMIDGLLSRFDFRQVPPKGPTKQQLRLEQWVESQKALGYTPTEIPDMLDPEVRMHYKDMTVEQLRGLMDTIKSVEKIGRERTTVTVEGKRMDVQEAVAPMLEKMIERGEKFTDAQLAEKPRVGVDPLWRVTLDRIASTMRAGLSEVLRTDYKANKYDLHELLGPFQRAITERLLKASYDHGDLMDEVAKIKRARAEEYGLDKNWQKTLDDVVDNHNLMDNSLPAPAKRRLTRSDLIGMAMHVGNESNFDKLVRGMRWEPTDVWKTLHDNMREKDWLAAKTMGEMAGAKWEDMAAMNRRLGNDNPEKIEPRPFKTKYGEMPGWYSPIDYDPLRSKLGAKKAEAAAINPAEGLFSSKYFRADTTTNGSLNSRASGYYDFINLDWRPIEKRVSDTMRDLAYREALIDVHKIYANKEFSQQFKRTYGPEEYQHLGDWLGRLVNSEVGDEKQSVFTAISSGTRRALVANGVAFRISTIIKHGGSALFKSSGYFAGGGGKYFASRLAAVATNHSAEVAEAIAKFPEIRQRARQQDRDFANSVASLLKPESIHGKAERFGHAGVAFFDFLSAVPTAHAAYDWAITEGIPKRLGGTGEPMSEEDAIRFANKVVREAHGSTNEASQSLLINNKSEIVKALTTLHGFMNNAFGQNADSLDKVLHAHGLGKPEVLARIMMAQIVPAIVAGWVTFGGPKDDESKLGWAFHHIAGEFAGMLPMVREAWSAVVEGRASAGLPSWIRALTDVYKVGEDTVKAAQGDDVKNPIKHAGNALGLWLPGGGQFGSSAQFLYDVATGKQEPETVGEWFRGVMSGTAKKD